MSNQEEPAELRELMGTASAGIPVIIASVVTEAAKDARSKHPMHHEFR